MPKRPNAYREGRVNYNEDAIWYILADCDAHAIEDELEKKREAKIRRRAKSGAAPKKPLATGLNPEGYLSESDLPPLPNFQETTNGISTTQNFKNTQVLHDRGDQLIQMPDIHFPQLFRKRLL